jgi:hypothetical protein
MIVVNSAYSIGSVFKLPVVLPKALCTFISVTVWSVIVRLKATLIKINDGFAFKLKLL